jgi:hypothetical protein
MPAPEPPQRCALTHEPHPHCALTLEPLPRCALTLEPLRRCALALEPLPRCALALRVECFQEWTSALLDCASVSRATQSGLFACLCLSFRSKALLVIPQQSGGICIRILPWPKAIYTACHSAAKHCLSFRSEAEESAFAFCHSQKRSTLLVIPQQNIACHSVAKRRNLHSHSVIAKSALHCLSFRSKTLLVIPQRSGGICICLLPFPQRNLLLPSQSEANPRSFYCLLSTLYCLLPPSG